MSLSEPQDIFRTPRQRIGDVLEAIAAKNGFTLADLRRHDRRPKTVAARNECFAYLRSLRWSYPQIGAFFDGMDHTTVMWALATPEYRARRNAERRAYQKQRKAKR